MKKLLLVFSLIIALVFPQATWAAPSEDPGPKTYMLVVDKLSIHDLDPALTPNLARIIRQGSVGLCSTRTLSGLSTENECLTIGAGNLARTYSNGIWAYNLHEPTPEKDKNAGELYQSLTGLNPDDSACLLVNLPELTAGLEKEPVSTRLGSLGEILGANGYKISILGNGDTSGNLNRATVTIAMDSKGRVPLGDISAKTTRYSSGVISIETNYPYVLSELKRLRTQSDVMVIDLSDLYRLENAPVALPEVQQVERARILKNIDDFAGQVLELCRPDQDLFLLISPSPAAAQINSDDTFTPIIAYGPGYRKGILSSPATQRDYIAANTDIAPTVLSFFGLQADKTTVIGQPIFSSPAGSVDTLQEAKDLAAYTSSINRLREPLVKGYVFILIIIVLLVLLSVLAFHKLAAKLPPFVLALGVVPFVYLILGKILVSNDILNGVLAAFLTILFIWMLIKITRGKYLNAFLIIAAVTLVTLNLDLLTGGSLLKSSVLGYDPMIGARYYGIGNEFMGVLIGCTILTAVTLYNKYPRTWMLGVIGLMFLSQCYMLAAPGLGASFDGVVTAPVAFLVTLALLAQFKPSARTVFITALVLLLSILGFCYYDLIRPSHMQSHIGRAMQQVVNGGWHEVVNIIVRKLGMNLKLIRYTIWSRVFLVLLGALIVLIYQPVGAMFRLRRRYPRLFQGFAGIITAAVIGLLINDSGIVAAATTSIYVAVPIILLTLGEVSAGRVHRGKTFINET